MTRSPILKLLGVLIFISLLAIAVAGYFSRGKETTGASSPVEPAAAEPSGAPVAASGKIIVGEQAQRNLALSAKPLHVESFWKTLTLPGMIVDKPGVSDRQIVAPATGIVTRILRVPGDTVRAGEVLCTLLLSSESMHQTQADLFKAVQDIRLAHDRLELLVAAGEGVPRIKRIEVESEITRLEAAAKAYRHELLIRGFTPDDLEQISGGTLIKEISIVVPMPAPGRPTTRLTVDEPQNAVASSLAPYAFELQELKVEAGQEVKAGDTLFLLSNHQSLAIEGRAFRDETLLLERTIKEGWPVEVDFQELPGGDWPTLEQSFHIQQLANTIDPVNRTFTFRIPLENQSQSVDRDGRSQLLWRFRPGQRVRLNVRVEELTNVFVLPADAVVREGGDAFVFSQNVNTFERKPVHVVFQDREHAVLANDGSLQTYLKGKDRWTIAAIVRNAAAQLNRMSKAGSTEVPKGFHIHADGSLHKNEDEAK